MDDASKVSLSALLDSVLSMYKASNSCPECHSVSGLREVIYGMPDSSLDESKYVVGGCCVSERDPSMICNVCGWEGDFVNNIDSYNLSDYIL